MRIGEFVNYFGRCLLFYCANDLTKQEVF